MQLADLVTQPHLFESLLGLSPAEYEQLDAEFKKTCDTTRKLPKSQKLIAAILTHRFKLCNQNIKNIIFSQPNTSTAVLESFKRSVMPRFNKALKKLPELDQKLCPTDAPISSSKNHDRIFSDLDELLNIVNLAVEKNTIITFKAQKMNKIWLDSYLKKPVHDKHKTGQGNFLQLLNCLLYDLDNFDSQDDYMAWYMAIVLNFNVHNSSYAPLIGYGKAQQREIDHPMLYARSQGKHVFGLFFKSLTASNRSAQCLLPKNEVVYKIFKTQYDNRFTKILSKYTPYGYLRKTETIAKGDKNYFSLQFAYSGLRHNAYSITVEGIRYALETKNAADVIQMINKDFNVCIEKPIVKLSDNRVMDQINYAHKKLHILYKKMAACEYFPNLYSALTRYRRENAMDIDRKVKNKLENVQVLYDVNTNVLDIKFYPNKKIEDTANYTQGVTNVIINFFIGLLNHKLHHGGIFVQAHRRQSFAFNRITVTDITNMCMRVSLGYEPKEFVSIFIDSLRSLDIILTKYNFLDKENKDLIKGFEVVEKARKNNEKCKAGTRFLNMMRSNKKILKSIVTAEFVLDKAIRNNNDESAAFRDYIKCLVANNLGSNNGHVIKVEPLINLDQLSRKDNILVIGLLHNLLKFILLKIESAKIYSENNDFAYSYWIIISKITKLAFKAHGWLEMHTYYPSSHVYAKTLLLIDDLLEYLIALDTLYIIREKPSFDNHDAASKLAAMEKAYAANSLALLPKNIDVFFTDNGQQALTVSLLCMSVQVSRESTVSNVSTEIFAFGKCYYELFDNLKKNMEIKLIKTACDAQFIYVDIREIKAFKEQQKFFIKTKVVVIDCTHHPSLSNNGLKDVIKQLLRNSIWIVIVGSMLKHEQLGLDKFQSGKLVVLSPPRKSLYQDVVEDFQSISKIAMHPVAASFFMMINEICRDKLGSFSSAIGMFSRNQTNEYANVQSSINIKNRVG